MRRLLVLACAALAFVAFAGRPETGREGAVAEAAGAPPAYEIGSNGLTLRPPGEAWRATLTTTRFGCESQLAPVARAAVLEPASATGRVEVVSRAGTTRLREWYFRGPLGVEHGFDLDESPCETPGEIVIEERLDGASAVLRGDRRGVDLGDDRGHVRAHYTDLAATDARGEQLPAWMEATADGIAIHVDARDATFPVAVDPLAWFEEQKLVATGGASTDLFGLRLALSGATAIVGAPRANSALGGAYVFVRSATGWVEQQSLVAGDASSQQLFGAAVAVDGDTAIVGAPGEPGFAGVAYVFTRSGTTWTEQQELSVSGGALNFGCAVAISGSMALVAASSLSPVPSQRPGTVYVYSLSGGVWTQEQAVQSSDEMTSDQFGSVIAVGSGTMVVAAPGATIGGNIGQGAVYVFSQSGSTFVQSQKLVASDGAANDAFGISLAIAGTTIVVGAPQATVGGNDAQGAAYAFAESGGAYTLRQKLVASDGVEGDELGQSVAVAGNTAIVGSTPKGSPQPHGLAYVFQQSNGTWTQSQKLSASDGAAGDSFGSAVVTDGAVAFVGAPGATIGNNLSQGAVYVEQLLAQPGTSCTQGTQCGSGYCVDGYCCDSACALQCQACDVPGMLGTCSVVNGNTHGSRTPCTSEGMNCGGTCDGMHADVCAYVQAGTTCGTSCSGVEETPKACDGYGVCVAGQPGACRSNFRCDESTGACYTACTDDSQCASGYLCAASQCAPGTVCLDGHTSQGPTGAQDCGAYSCDDATGLCNTGCTTVDECSAPNVCDFTGACVAPPSTSVLESGGCAVAGRLGAPSSAPVAPSAIALLALVRTRTARRRRAR